MPEASHALEDRPGGVPIRQAIICDILASLASNRGEKTALIFGGQRITYQDLASQVSRLACGLSEKFAPGELVAIWLPNCPELLCLCLACTKTGIVPMPLHQGMKWPEVREILKHAKARWLITSELIAGPHLADIAGDGLRGIYVTGQDQPPAPCRSYVELMESGGDFRHAAISPDALGLILHTSGSNGRAKGVMLSYANIEHILQYRLNHTMLGPDSLSIVGSCLTQSVGFYQSLALLAAGGTMVLLDSCETDRMVDCINQYHPTHLIMVVDAFDRILHHPGITKHSLRRLAFASAGADRVTSRVQKRFIVLTGGPLRVSYGMTESSWALVNPGDRMDRCLALGKPCPDIEVMLRDAEGREVTVGEVGEIFIRSPRTMLGYLNDEDLTRHTLVDGWLASGDLAYRDSDGYFWFSGRTKNIIVLSSGDNISPVEVENAVLSHPSVSHCRVAGVATAHGSEVPWAFVTRLDETLSEAALAEFLRDKISDFKIPRKIVFVEELPVGRTGKVHARHSIASTTLFGATQAPPCDSARQMNSSNLPPGPRARGSSCHSNRISNGWPNAF